jgi:hypothetical protein
MSFVTPKWDSAQNNYVIDVTEALQKSTQVGAGKDNTGSTVFRDGENLKVVLPNISYLAGVSATGSLGTVTVSIT